MTPASHSDYMALQEQVDGIENRLDRLQNTLDKLDRLSERIEGMSILTKTVFWVAGPLFLLGMWIKDHVKW